MQETKTCLYCDEDLPLSAFYQYKRNGAYHGKCKKCTLYLQKIGDTKSNEAATERALWALKNEPGVFSNDEQKQYVHQFLDLMGWIHNPIKSLWYKKGIKDANGIWKKVKLIEKKPKKVPKVKKITKGQIFRDNLAEAREMRRNGALLREIAAHYGISTTTVKQTFKKYEEQT